MIREENFRSSIQECSLDISLSTIFGGEGERGRRSVRTRHIDNRGRSGNPERREERVMGSSVQESNQDSSRPETESSAGPCVLDTVGYNLRDSKKVPASEGELEWKQQVSVLRTARNLLEREELLDVTLVCLKEEEVKASRSFLAASSEYFSKLFYGSMREKGLDRIPLPDAGAKYLRMIIEYLHGCACQSPPYSYSDMVNAYALADQYQVVEFCNHVSGSIALMLLNKPLCIVIGEVLSTALHRGLDEIVEMAMMAFQRHDFNACSFMGWSMESVVFCLDHASMEASEQDFAEAVVNWASLQLDGGAMTKESSAGPKDEESTQRLAEVIKHLKLEFVNPDFIVEHIEPLGVVSEHVLLSAYRSQAQALSSKTGKFQTKWRSSTGLSLAKVKSEPRPFPVNPSPFCSPSSLRMNPSGGTVPSSTFSRPTVSSVPSCPSSSSVSLSLSSQVPLLPASAFEASINLCQPLNLPATASRPFSSPAAQPTAAGLSSPMTTHLSSTSQGSQQSSWGAASTRASSMAGIVPPSSTATTPTAPGSNTAPRPASTFLFASGSSSSSTSGAGFFSFGGSRSASPAPQNGSLPLLSTLVGRVQQPEGGHSQGSHSQSALGVSHGGSPSVWLKR